MSEEIMKKLKEHDARFDAHDARFDEHDEQLELIAGTVVKHTEILNQHTELLDKHTAQLDLLVKRSVDHGARLERIEENMVTKQEFNRHTDAVDEIVKLYRKKDVEMTFMSKHVQRIEEDVKKMKPLLGLT